MNLPSLNYSSAAVSLIPGKDFDTLDNCGSAHLENVRVMSVSDGCTLEDFSSSGFVKGSVALLAREPAPKAVENIKVDLMPDAPSLACNYRTKISNAIKAGASGALIYSRQPIEGAVLGRVGPDAKNFPVLGIAHPIALDVRIYMIFIYFYPPPKRDVFNRLQKKNKHLIQLLEKIASSSFTESSLLAGKKKVPPPPNPDSGVRINLTTDVHFSNITTLNVLAETRTGNASNTIVMGSHLDSVIYGPGVNGSILLFWFEK